MSLLNDALQDLDRRAGDASPDGAAQVTPTALPAPHKSRWLLPGLAAAAVLLAWVLLELGLFGQSTGQPEPQATSVHAQSADTEAQMPTNERAEAYATVTAVVPAAAPASSTEPPVPGAATAKVEQVVQATAPPPKPSVMDRDETTSQGGAIGNLLEAAAQALAQDRLMTPANNNAFQLYSSLLLLTPDNHAAQEGIRKIQSRYLELADTALQMQKQSAAKKYLQRASKAGATSDQLQPFKARLAAIQPEQAAQPEVKPRIVFDKDADLAQRLRSEPLARHESRAWSRLRSAPKDGVIAIALADAYAAEQNHSQLLKLEQTVAGAEPQVKAYVQAQRRITHGDFAAAPELLAAFANADGLEPHQRLLAGVHAAAGDYTQALPLYRRLIQLGEFHLNDWLGFAVALERVGQRDDALAAYTKISRARHADARINEYIHRRIRALSNDF